MTIHIEVDQEHREQHLRLQGTYLSVNLVFTILGMFLSYLYCRTLCHCCRAGEPLNRYTTANIETHHLMG